MIFYITIFTLLALFSLIEIIGLDKKQNLIYYFVFCLLLFVLSFIRWETGTDWESYYNYFISINDSIDDNYNFEIGFRFLAHLIAAFSNNYTIFLFIQAMILFLFQSVGIIKLSVYPLYSLFFLWSIQFANILFVRQWIAVSILFFSISFIKNRKIIPFVLCVLLAILFHRTSFIFLFAWWIFKLNISKKVMIITLVSSVFFSFLLEKLIEVLSGGFGNVIRSKIDIYMNSDYNEELNADLNIYVLIIKGFANKFFIIFLSFYFYESIITRYPQFKGYLNIYWFGAIIYFCTISISIVLVRFSYTFDIIQIILLPFCFKVINSPVKKILLFLIVGVYFFLRFEQALSGPYKDELVPYKTILIN